MTNLVIWLGWYMTIGTMAEVAVIALLFPCAFLMGLSNSFGFARYTVEAMWKGLMKALTEWKSLMLFIIGIFIWPIDIPCHIYINIKNLMALWQDIRQFERDEIKGL